MSVKRRLDRVVNVNGELDRRKYQVKSYTVRFAEAVQNQQNLILRYPEHG